MIIAMCAIVILSTPIHDDSYILNRIEMHTRFNFSNEYLEEAIEDIYITNSKTEIFDFNINISNEEIGNGIIKDITVTYKEKLHIPFLWHNDFDTFTIMIDKSIKDYIKIN